MSDANRIPTRILVGAGSYVDAAAALRIVERLVRDADFGLGGILVEEVTTLAICEIPNKFVVSRSGATVRAPDKIQLRNLMAADARAFRESLSRTAMTTGTNSVFTQEAGELISTALRAAVGWDILVIGYRRFNAVPGKIVLLEGSGVATGEMNQAAALLARQFSVGQVVFSVDPEFTDQNAAHNPMHRHFMTLQQAVTALARTNAQAVLVDLVDGPLRNADDLARLLDVARCPLIIFGASNVHTLSEHSTHVPATPT